MINRAAEEKALEKIYSEAGNSLTLIYGSNRSDKESFIRSFCKDKDAFYYRARNASPKEQLSQLKSEVEDKFGIKLGLECTYDDCFRNFKSKTGQKIVVVIDEFQTIARKDEGFFPTMINLKEKKLYPGPVMIILCNSSLAWTEKEMDDCLGSAAQKIDERIKLSEVSFLDIVRLFPDYRVEESVKTYGILGGVPEYLSLWNKKKTVKENICELILTPGGALFREAEDFIGSELRELSVYDTILSSIARGNEKLNDLFIDTGYSRAKISVYMKNLAAFDVIEKVVSFETGGWDNAKKGVYRIKNHYVNFWFRFIYPHLSALYLTTPEKFYEEYIEKDLDVYLRRFFVEVCQEYLLLMNRVGKVPIRLERMGTWVGKTGTIDIIGEDNDRNHIVGICNWEKPNLTMEEYEKLLENMGLARIKARTVYLFSAKGFDLKITSYAKDNKNVVLVDMKEL